MEFICSQGRLTVLSPPGPEGALRRRLATRLRALAKQQGVSVRQFADLCSVGRSTMHKIVNEQQYTRLDTIARIANALGMEDPADLLAKEEK